jgi:hypothetical protein
MLSQKLSQKQHACMLAIAATLAQTRNLLVQYGRNLEDPTRVTPKQQAVF